MPSNTLFPPIVETYQPVFIEGETCKIYFSFTSFNSPNDINTNLIQLSLRNSNTNRSLLDVNKYPNEIKTHCELKSENGRYYVELLTSDYGSNLELNQYYKVQLRFVEKSVSDYTFLSDEYTWLQNNADSFSNWSSVTLISKILKPSVNFIDTSFSHLSATIAGTLSFNNINNLDVIDGFGSYRLQIMDAGNEIEDSGLIYIDNFNSLTSNFNYTLKNRLLPNHSYLVKCTYTTMSGYEGYVEQEFSTPIFADAGSAVSVTCDPEPRTASIKINVKGSEGTLYLSRSSYKDNFSSWFTVVEEQNYTGSFSWTDTTIESGVMYKYAIEIIGAESNLYKEIEVPVMIEFDNIFFINKDIQFAISFNSEVSNFKYMVNESVTATLGSKYPFVRRNGNNYYRQFTVGGLISFLADLEEDGIITDSCRTSLQAFPAQTPLFLSKKEAMKNALSDYEEYNKNNRILSFEDYIFEKMYRDKAMEFLCDDNVKLFKSNTEGNILVKLTNISFTPTANLGRLVYSFSATATEIDECSFENYYKYGIIKGRA